MEMHQVKHFLAVAETLNFTRAAENCRITQPAFTKSIQRLEEYLGGQLLHRSKTAVSLTEFGKSLYPSLQELYSMARKIRTSAKNYSGNTRRSVTIGIMCTIGLQRFLPWLRAIEQAYPNWDMHYDDGTIAGLYEKLDRYEIDLVLCSSPLPPPKRFNSDPLLQERFLIAFPDGHRFAAMKQVPIKALNGEVYISRARCEYADLLTDLMANQGAVVSVRHETAREDWIQQMVMAGLGVAFVPESMILFPKLQTRPVTEPDVTRNLNLVYRTNTKLGHDTVALCELAKQTLAVAAAARKKLRV